ncbi:MAG: mechanosensitive ion channel [Brachymonas sp.]|nr:mechanosensitive ion channel [Brachymonas sp.]
MNLNTLSESLQASLGGNIPQLLGALAIFVVGWLVAVAVRAAARKGLSALRLNPRFGEMTGQPAVDIEGGIALILFWLVLLLTLSAVFNVLNLASVSGPFSVLTTRVLDYIPRLVVALLLAAAAWLVASLVRTLVSKALDKTTLDERLSAHAGMAPISGSLTSALFWLVILLFLPAILAALQMDGLLEPLRQMMAKGLDMLPNILAAVIIGGIGWIVATILRNLVGNLLRTANVDGFGQRAGFGKDVQFSSLAGWLVFLAVFIPSLIAALDALKIEAISRPATQMLGMLMQSVPHIVAAVLILVVTWMVANFVIRLVTSLLASSGFDALPAKLGIAHVLGQQTASNLVGRALLLFAMLFAAVEAGNQLGFSRFSDIITTFIAFAGDVLLGGAILVIGFLLANVVADAIKRTAGEHSLGLSRLARFAILGLVIAMGLRAMGIADDIVNLAFGLTLGSVAVVVALAFGLGGREPAGRLMARWLDRVSNDKRD